MGRVAPLLAAAVLGGCGVESDEPTLDAWRDGDGVLHVVGSGWDRCGPVDVTLPKPWSGGPTPVEARGSFELLYARALVRDYSGMVTASQRCSDDRIVVTDRIDVRR